MNKPTKSRKTQGLGANPEKCKSTNPKNAKTHAIIQTLKSHSQGALLCTTAPCCPLLTALFAATMVRLHAATPSSPQPCISFERLSLLSPSKPHHTLPPDCPPDLGDETDSFAEQISNPRKEMRPAAVSNSQTPDGTNGWSSDRQIAIQALERRLPFPGKDALDIASSGRKNSKGSRLRTRRRNRTRSSSVRESFLAEAWERKRELMLHEKQLMSSLEKTTPEQFEPSQTGAAEANKLPSGGESPGSPNEATRTSSRTRSLTDDDFEELRRCIDLGFRFDQNCVSNLYGTLPALEVYHAVTQSLNESPKCMSPVAQRIQSSEHSSSSPAWKVASPGDDPNHVKGRLRHWAQAVACSVRLCS